jgi:hypothetical protein
VSALKKRNSKIKLDKNLDKDFVGGLDKEMVKFLTDLTPVNVLAQSFVFVYKGQAPNIALYVLSGEVIKGGEHFSIEAQSRGMLLALPDFLKKRASLYEIKVLQGAEVCIISLETAEKIIKK